MSFCLYNKKNITWRLEDMNIILFSRGKNSILPLENKIHIFAPPCNILYVYTLLFFIYLFIFNTFRFLYS